MKAANDRGSRRIFELIDIRYIAYRLGVTDGDLLEFCLAHEAELCERIQQAALDILEQHGYEEGLLELSEPVEGLSEEIEALLSRMPLLENE